MPYVILAVLLALCEAGYIKFARKAGIVSMPTPRSSHTEPTVVGGGVVYYLSVAGFAVMGGVEYPGFITAASMLAMISFIDDMHPVGVLPRLAVQFLAVGVAFAGVPGVDSLPLWAVALGAVCAVGLVNGWNFMDGINGLTGSYTLLTLLTLLYVDVMSAEPFVDPALLICGTIASAIFCVCNFRHRALCFAGDVGAVTAAFIVTYSLGRLVLATGSLAWTGLVAVYGVDVILTLIHRMLLRQNIFRPHRLHLYQLLANEGGMGQLRVAATYTAIQLAVSAGLIFLPVNPYIYLAAATGVLCMAYLLVERRLY